MVVPNNHGVFLQKMLILGCFGGTTIEGNTHIGVGLRTWVFFKEMVYSSADVWDLCTIPISILLFILFLVYTVYFLNEMLNCWFWEGDVVRKCRIPERAFIDGGINQLFNSFD